MLAPYIHIACIVHANGIGKIIKISNSLGQLLPLKCPYSFPIIFAFSQLRCKIYRQEINYFLS